MSKPVQNKFKLVVKVNKPKTYHYSFNGLSFGSCFYFYDKDELYIKVQGQYSGDYAVDLEKGEEIMENEETGELLDEKNPPVIPVDAVIIQEGK